VDRVRRSVGLLVRGLVARLASTIMLLVAGTLAVATVVIAPLYVPAAKNALVIAQLRSTSNQQDGLVLGGAPSPVTPKALLAAYERAPRVDGHRVFGRPILTALEQVSLPSTLPYPSVSPAGQLPLPQTTQLLERTGICGHLEMLAGQCPARRGESGVAISARDAVALHLRVGSTVTYGIGNVAPNLIGATKSTVRVVGIYAVPSSTAPYWWGTQYFDFSSGPQGNVYDPFVVAPGFFHGASPFPNLVASGVIPPSAVALTRELQAPFVGTSIVSATTAPRLAAELTRYLARLSTHGVPAGSQLPQTLATTLAHDHVFSTISVVVVVEMLAIGELVLVGLLARSMLAREAELRLGLLRGVGTWRIVRRLVAEPLVATLLTVPLGTLMGWYVVRLVARLRFPPGISVPLSSTALAVALVTAGLAVGTTVVIVLVGLRRSVVALPRAEQRRRAILRAALEVALLSVAATGTVELLTALRTSSGIAPLAAAAPALLTLGLVVLGSWLFAGAVRLVARATHATRRLSLYVAVRQLRRDSGGLQRPLVVGLAVGLVIFGLALEEVGQRIATATAAFQTGAFEVAPVSLPPGLDLQHAVEVADPLGREAMAAQRISTPSGTTLAIQASRAPGVLDWPTSLGLHPTVTRLVRLIDPISEGSFPVVGTTVELRVEITAGARLLALLRQEGTSFSGALQPNVTLAIATPTHSGLIESDLAVTSPNRPFTVAATLPRACLEGGCWLNSVTLTIGPLPAPARLLILGASGLGASPRGGPLDPRAWRASAPTSTGPGPAWTIEPNVGSITLAAAALPTSIPSVIGAQLQGSEQAGQPLLVTSLDTSTLQASPVAVVPALPVVGPSAALVDLRLAQTMLTGTDAATSLVFLGPHDPASVLGRLEREGVSIRAIASTSTALAALRNSPTAYAQGLVLPAGLGAAALVLTGVLFESLTDGRSRIAELAALRVLGMRRTQLVTSLLIEGAAIVVLGVLVGFAGGIAGASFVLPHVLTPPQPFEVALSLPYRLPYSILVRSSALVVILGAFAIAASAARVVGRASFEQLRAGER